MHPEATVAAADKHARGSQTRGSDESRRKVVMASAQPKPDFPALSGRYWARTSDPQLVELVLSQLS